jgi:hypothetical protein
VSLRGKNRWLLGMAATLLATAIRDIANPIGLLRRIAEAILPEKK